MNNRITSAVFFASVLTLIVSSISAAPVSRDTSAELDREFDNLGDSLLEGLVAPPQRKSPHRKPQAPERKGKDWLPDTETMRRRMQQEMNPRAGEDAGQGQESPMVGVIEGMREAEQLLGTHDSERGASPVQRRVVAELEKLIAQMEKQCQGGQCDKPKDGKKQASKRSKPKPGGAKPGGKTAKASQAAARESTTRMGSAPAGKGAFATPDDLMKAAWGHLPERVRERMLQSSSDEFLPEYREEIEAYYRRLAEREANDEE